MVKDHSDSEKEFFYLTMYSTHFIYGYMASDNERGNLLPSLHGPLFPISKGSFLYQSWTTGWDKK